MNRIVNIMPMAGLGKRFVNSNFKIPKPLISIKNKPMFLQSCKSLPSAHLNIFICNKKLITKFNIKKLIKKEFKNKFKIITVKKITNGQATTCLQAEKYLQKNDKIFIHPCDVFIKYNYKKLLKEIDKNDAVILTARPNKVHLNNINSYGWVNYKKDKINKITCKTKASSTPRKDLVIVGSFLFKDKIIFSKTIKSLFKKKKKVNNEYYMDMVLSNAMDENYKITSLNVNSYVSWGTPKELLNWKIYNKFK